MWRKRVDNQCGYEVIYWELEIHNREDVVWQVTDSSSRVDFPSNKYSAHRCTGYVGDIDDVYLDRDGKSVCGPGIFCAIGLPTIAQFKTVEEAQKICEQDKDRLQL